MSSMFWINVEFVYVKEFTNEFTRIITIIYVILIPFFTDFNVYP